MPRTIPQREREWLSWTNSSRTPRSSKTSRRYVSMKNPRASPWTTGSTRTGPSSLVGRRCIARQPSHAPATSRPRGRLRPCEATLLAMSVDVSVIGLGRVGLPLALCFADRGLRVHGIDNDAERLLAVEGGTMPFEETGAQELLERVRASGRLTLSDS